jgi:hypothetical protein
LCVCVCVCVCVFEMERESEREKKELMHTHTHTHTHALVLGAAWLRVALLKRVSWLCSVARREARNVAGSVARRDTVTISMACSCSTKSVDKERRAGACRAGGT